MRLISEVVEITIDLKNILKLCYVTCQITGVPAAKKQCLDSSSQHDDGVDAPLPSTAAPPAASGDSERSPQDAAQSEHAKERATASLDDEAVLLLPVMADSGVPTSSTEEGHGSTAPSVDSQPQGGSAVSSSSLASLSSASAMASSSGDSVASSDSGSGSSGNGNKRPSTTGREKPTLIDIIVKSMDTIFGRVRRAKDT